MPKVPVYESWEWKPKRGEIVMASMDGEHWVPLFYYDNVGHAYPDRPYQCAESVYASRMRYVNIFAWKYIAKPQDVLTKEAGE